jgi:hypothetical protein
MPIVLIIGLCAWATVAFVVLAVCRQAARGDEALIAAGAGSHRFAHHLHTVAVSTNSRAAARAQSVAAHRGDRARRARPARLS